jgi:hypothetical protein
VAVDASVPETAGGTVVETEVVDVGSGPVSLYVSSTLTDSVLVYDGETGAFQRTFASGGGLTEPEGLAFGPDGNLYDGSRSDEVLRHDGQTGAFVDVFASGNGLVDRAGIGFGGPDDDLFVSSGIPEDGVGGNQILRFDGVTGAFETVVDPTTRRASRPRRDDLWSRWPAVRRQHS